MTTDCIEWSGTRWPNGYGRIQHGGVRMLAHRVAWVQERGAIPAGMVVCHTCDNPPCVNVDHLFLGTQSDNIRDAYVKGRALRGNPFQARKSACPQGHPYDEVNTYIDPRGARQCRTCRRAAIVRRDLKRKAYR